MTAVNVNQARASLYKKIAQVMGKVERVPKRGRNNFHNYDYVTESDLVDHVRKFMVEEGLVLFNNIREYEIVGEIAVVTIEFTLCCIDTGESVTTAIVAEGADKGDKKFYKAMAGGTKYYLMKTFLIPTGDDPEADSVTDQRAYGQRGQQSQQQGQSGRAAGESMGSASKPITPKQKELIQQRINEILNLVEGDEATILDTLRSKIGEFESTDTMSSLQASKAIEQLTKWKANYSNR